MHVYKTMKASQNFIGEAFVIVASVIASLSRFNTQEDIALECRILFLNQSPHHQLWTVLQSLGQMRRLDGFAPCQIRAMSKLHHCL